MLNKYYNKLYGLLNLPRYTKYFIVQSVDIILCVLTVWIAAYLRLGEFVSLLDKNLYIACIASVVLCQLIYNGLNVYNTIYRHFNINSINSLLKANLLYALLYIIIITALGVNTVPRTIGIIQPILLLLSTIAVRCFVNYWFMNLRFNSIKKRETNRALVYGAGKLGRELVYAMRNNINTSILGFIDDDISLQGRTINNHTIYSSNNIQDILESKRINLIFLALSSISRTKRNKIINFLRQYHVEIRTIPSVNELASGVVTVSDIRELDIQDLLDREPVIANKELMAQNISNKIVLVTGAGGSIGSEICKQIFLYKPQALILLDISEYSLYKIKSTLEGYNESRPSSEAIKLIPLIGSVLNIERLSGIFKVWKPNTIYHTAAYKHVPLVEQNITEGIYNNIFGAINIAKLAIENHVQDFVFISTDKAVRPTNIMGATKRVAEICLQALNNKHSCDDINIKTKLSMVRFGNVLGSSGSVIPLFRKQISNGGPITITHSNITRYFMTIPEAAQLVIQAGAMAKGGDVFILDMGEQIKITDIAKRMVELSGLTVKDENNPEGDIEFTITGLRPGEKLYEELLLGDAVGKTDHPKILKAHEQFIEWNELSEKLTTLKSALKSQNFNEVLNILKILVDGFSHNSILVDLTYNDNN